ncbi:MAG: helix-turn-helix domain-containing protein [Gallintestinimicrobium sp.]
MLGEQIKRCREKRGFTQEQLAEKIGVSIETISSIERGIKMPKTAEFCGDRKSAWRFSR